MDVSKGKEDNSVDGGQIKLGDGCGFDRLEGQARRGGRKRESMCTEQRGDQFGWLVEDIDGQEIAMDRKSRVRSWPPGKSRGGIFKRGHDNF